MYSRMPPEKANSSSRIFCFSTFSSSSLSYLLVYQRSLIITQRVLLRQLGNAGWLFCFHVFQVLVWALIKDCAFASLSLKQCFSLKL